MDFRSVIALVSSYFFLLLIFVATKLCDVSFKSDRIFHLTNEANIRKESNE